MQCLVSKPIFKMLVSKYQKHKELGPINWFTSEILDFDIRNHTEKNLQKFTKNLKRKRKKLIWKFTEIKNLKGFTN